MVIITARVIRSCVHGDGSRTRLDRAAHAPRARRLPPQQRGAPRHPPQGARRRSRTCATTRRPRSRRSARRCAWTRTTACSCSTSSKRPASPSGGAIRATAAGTSSALTAAGRQALERAERAQESIEDEVLAALGQDDRALLRDLLRPGARGAVSARRARRSARGSRRGMTSSRVGTAARRAAPGDRRR